MISRDQYTFETHARVHGKNDEIFSIPIMEYLDGGHSTDKIVHYTIYLVHGDLQYWLANAESLSQAHSIIRSYDQLTGLLDNLGKLQRMQAA